MKGIDVSSYNGSIHWGLAKEDGVEFAILKVIRKDLEPDKAFEANYEGCEKAGVTIQGVYNYSYATSVAKATSDARKVLSILGERRPMVWLDVEDACQKNLGMTLIDIINAYCDVINGAGLDFGVYTGLSFYNSYIKPYYENIRKIPFWIARYPSTKTMDIEAAPNESYKPDVKSFMYGWQYSSKGSVNGVNGNVDLNEWYVDIQSENVVVVTPVEQAKERPVLKYGDTGKDVQEMQEALIKNNYKTCVICGKKKELKADGAFGNITKSILGRFQDANNLKKDYICGEKTWGKLL